MPGILNEDKDIEKEVLSLYQYGNHETQIAEKVGIEVCDVIHILEKYPEWKEQYDWKNRIILLARLEEEIILLKNKELYALERFIEIMLDMR